MFKYLQNRRMRKLEAQQAKAKAELNAKREELEKLNSRSDELRQLLIKAGIHPFNWCNHHVGGKYVRMYGVLNNELIEASLGIKGGLVVKYVKEDQREG